MKRTPVFAANWKMNKALSDVAPYCAGLRDKLSGTNGLGETYQVVIAPPATHLASMVATTLNSKVEVSAQNSGTAKSGAFTGEISPVTLKELNVGWTILGHSERRHVYKEDDALVIARTKAAFEEGLKVIFCVGEKIEERKAGKTNTVVETQLSVLKQLPPANLKNLVIAYEPVWAIGTGETATPKQAQEVHAFIRSWLARLLGSEVAGQMRILYGGSVKPDNSKEIMAEPDVDGLLVGGASLDPTSFASLIQNGLTSSKF